ncbi:hypothetical protein [Nonomuraea guangzhouensis]|uniref:Uncharacterized protein n=1 Tax=Nonomuraea guangzhouensis TaxID=1291555 RepID=A0ABW4GNG8_9ACTN|nr:hypothetical protein [Nonomuraea guangzhouensis]
MSSRKFRLAVATLTVAVSWTAAGPAAARSSFDASDGCTGPSAEVTSSASTVRVCDDSTDLVVLDGSQGGSAGDRLSMAAMRLADRLGVAGLATGRSVMNIADQGGMAATTGASTLPGGIPGTAGLADVSRLAEAPDLPMPRHLPHTGNLADDATAAGSRIVGTVAESPVGPLQSGSPLQSGGPLRPVDALPPVDQVKRETVDPVLPEVPDRAPAIDGVNGLIQRLALD